MFFKGPVFINDQSHPLFSELVEQAEYLRGILLSDEEYRLDEDFDTALIDPYGTGTNHFWRGVVEASGSLYMRPAGRYRYPFMEVRGSRAFLGHFLKFLEESLSNPPFKFDQDGKLAWQINGGFIRFSGNKARDVVVLLYTGAQVRRDKYSNLADEMFAWVGNGS